MKTALITCCKHEECYIEEFIEHYINIGIDTIFICDNNELDYKYQILPIIQKYIDNGFVVYKDYRGVVDVVHKCYDDIYFSECDNYDWFCIFDTDEFLNIDKFNNISELLDHKIFDNVDFIICHWVCMISENIIIENPKKPVKETYTKMSHTSGVDIIKSIIKGRQSDKITRIMAHYPFFKEGINCKYCFINDFNKDENSIITCETGSLTNVNVKTPVSDSKTLDEYIKNINTYRKIHLKHYINKSLEEYIDKMFYRGPGDRSKKYYEYMNPEKMFYRYMKFYDIDNKPELWYLNYKKIFFEKIPKY